MATKQLVLAFFENEDTADQAVAEIKQWDKVTKEIKLVSIGVLVKDDKGKVKTHKLGARHTTTGAAAGVLAAVLSGGLTLLGGVVLGSLVGAFIHKGLGLSKEDLAWIGGELDGGSAQLRSARRRSLNHAAAPTRIAGVTYDSYVICRAAAQPGARLPAGCSASDRQRRRRCA